MISKNLAQFFGVLIAILSVEAEAVVVYDESVNGPLPRTVSFLSPEEMEVFTFNLEKGISEVIGESQSGEAFLVRVPVGRKLIGISVEFGNPIDGNTHILAVDAYPINMPVCTLAAGFSHQEQMPTIGNYSYLLTFSKAAKPGTYRVYSGTAVHGTPVGSPFKISFIVDTAPLFADGFECIQFDGN